MRGRRYVAEPPRTRTLILLAALFVWFASGVEAWKIARPAEFEARPLNAAWPPWRALRLYVSFGGDERLYFQYAQLIFGQKADLTYVASKQQGDAVANLARLTSQVRVLGARLPYRDFPVEYPPLAVLWMALPRLFTRTLAQYRVAFAAASAALYFLLTWVAARLALLLARPSVESVWRRMGWLALAAGPLLCQRFDLLPATLTTAALLALCRRRDLLAGILLGLGAMTKLYPALLALPLCAFLAGDRTTDRPGTAPAFPLQRALTVAASAGATTLAVAAPFLVAAPTAFLRSVLVYGARPYQIESLPGGVALALTGGGGVFGAFGSYNVSIPGWAAALASTAFWIALGALVAIAARNGSRVFAAADRNRALVALACAAIAVVICTSKVLSPQFLIWLLPLPAILPRNRLLMYWGVASLLLTQGFHPFLYSALRAGHPLVIAVLLARNAALVAFAVSAIGEFRRTIVTSAGAPLRPGAALSS